MITGGASAKALTLLKAFQDATVLLADYGDMPAVPMKNFQFVTLGEKNPDTAAHILLKSCLDAGVDIILPLHEFEIIAISESTLLFNEFGIHALVPEPAWFGNTHEEATTKDWAILDKGKVLFSTVDCQSTAELTGAFYLNAEHQPVKLFAL